MRAADEFSIELNHILKEEYSNLRTKVGPYSNIIGVFFHEIMIYLSNYYLIKNSKYEYKHKIKFPYLNSDYVVNIEYFTMN